MLQSFDLLQYGEPMILFIVEQLKKQNIKSYWTILGALVYVLPPQLAVSALKNEKSLDTMRHSDEPIRLKEICMQLVLGSAFKPAAALAVAELFDKLKEDDLIQEETWNEYGNEFEALAYEYINKIESNRLLFVLLNIPLLSNNRDSLVELALDGKRIEFLNNDRINSVIQHLYIYGYLNPGQDVRSS